MHPDGAVHAVVADDHNQRQPVFDRGHELQPGHLEAAVAGERDDRALGMLQLGRHRRGQAISHRARGRRELGAKLPVAPEPMHPDGIIAGAVADDGVVGQAIAQTTHDLRELHVAGRVRRLGKGQIVGMRRLDVVGTRPMLRLQPLDRTGKGRAACDHAERRRIDAADLFGIGINMNQRLPWLRNIEQRVAGCGGLPQPRAKRDHQIAVADPVGDFCVETDADMAAIAGMQIIEIVLAAERNTDGHFMRRRKSLEIAARLIAPSAAADNQEGLLRL